MRTLAAVTFSVCVGLILVGCGGSSGGSGSSSSPATNPEEPYVQTLNIRPRPPESTIPVALRHLKQALDEPKSPGSLEAAIRRSEAETDVLYEVGRCRENEEVCDFNRWEELASKLGRQEIKWGFASSISGKREASRAAVQRTEIERGFRRETARNGVHSLGARIWAHKLLALELISLGSCRGIPTCPYQRIERKVASLERATRPAKGE